MHNRYTGVRWRGGKNGFKKIKKSQQIRDHSRVSADCDILIFNKTKGQAFHGVPGSYSTSLAVDYTAVIFSAHIPVKMRGFHSTSTRKIQLCAQPADAIPPAIGKSRTPVHCTCEKI